MENNFAKLAFYGFYGSLRMIKNLIKTKIFFRKSRLIRFPIDIRGKKYIDFGLNLTTGICCRIEAYPFLFKKKIVIFGDNVEINDFVHIAGISSVIIGNNVLIASKVFISDIQHGCYKSINIDNLNNPEIPPRSRPLSSGDVIIEDNVWIGESVSILSGVRIGKGSIIGANSVVTKSISAYVIAIGSPAKAVKKYNFKSNTWERI